MSDQLPETHHNLDEHQVLEAADVTVTTDHHQHEHNMEHHTHDQHVEVQEQQVTHEHYDPNAIHEHTDQVNNAALAAVAAEAATADPEQLTAMDLVAKAVEMQPQEVLPDTMEGLQKLVQELRHASVHLTEQINLLTQENEKLRNADPNMAEQMTNYQTALAVSESQKSHIIAENQILRQRCAQAGITVNDVISPVAVQADDQQKAAADLAIDISEAGEMAALQEQHQTFISTHTHAQYHQTHEIVNHHHGHTPNTAGLSSRSEEKWEAHFRDLVQYKEEHGNCLVPTSTELGRWLCRQRHNFRYKSLKEDRKARLMELDKTCLGERVAELGSGTYTDKDGNVIETEAMPMLATPPPINTKTKYNQEYESKLHEKWNKFYVQLLEYKEKHGHSNFPTMNGSLGRWISRQRTLYRSKKLKADRYEKLIAIGFKFEDAKALEFKGKLDQQWEEMYEKLLEHKNKKGHCFDVPETLPLGKWLYRQRWLYRHGNLREDRAKKLLDIGFEDKKVLKRGGVSSGGPKKKRKVDDEVEATTVEEQEGLMMQELAVPEPHMEPNPAHVAVAAAVDAVIQEAGDQGPPPLGPPELPVPDEAAVHDAEAVAALVDVADTSGKEDEAPTPSVTV